VIHETIMIMDFVLAISSDNFKISFRFQLVGQ